MKLILIAAILVATATAYSYDEASFTEQPDAIDEILVDVNAGINAMKSKGAKESDCLDLAKTSCKEVERERSINQGMLNKLADGSKCPPLGQGQVTKTKNHYLKTKTTWKTMKYRLTVAKNKRVYFANQKFNTMTKGNCGFVFSSRNYLNAKKALDNAILNERVWKGKTSEAHKAWQTAIKIAAKRKHICLCDAQVTASHVWSTVANSKLVAKQNRAHTKCKMMSCILKGKNVRSAQCQGSLPGLKRKVLTAATRRENCKGHVVAKSKKKKWHRLMAPMPAVGTKGKNSWSGWYTKGKNFYSTLKVDKLKFQCISKGGNVSNVVGYDLNKGYKGRTLLDIVKRCGLNARSRNNNSAKWKKGHCTNVGKNTENLSAHYKTVKKGASSGLADGSPLRIGVGDGSNDGSDWALFMFSRGNGRGDYAGAKIWDFGGESNMNDRKTPGAKCWIWGYGN